MSQSTSHGLPEILEANNNYLILDDGAPTDNLSRPTCGLVAIINVWLKGTYDRITHSISNCDETNLRTNCTLV